jgi:hypothetical protein
MSKFRNLIRALAVLLALGLAHGASSYATPWESAIDPVTKARFIPVELWTGAEWDGSEELKMSKAEMLFGSRLKQRHQGADGMEAPRNRRNAHRL